MEHEFHGVLVVRIFGTDVGILTGSRLIQVTADFVRRYGGLGGIMRIYREDAAVDAALATSSAR